MVGFGELRKLSLKWRTDIPSVERTYALDWLVKAIFERPALLQALALQGSTALGKVYFPEYPPISDVDLALNPLAPAIAFDTELGQAAADAARESGLGFRLHSIHGAEARFEFTGPLGRRSASQPRLPVRWFKTTLRSDSATLPLVHPFSEPFETLVPAVSLEEITAKYIAMLAQRPRARDLFDLWFVLEHDSGQINRPATRTLALRFAAEKGRQLSVELDPAYRPLLERVWEGALTQIPSRPAFDQAEGELKSGLAEILG